MKINPQTQEEQAAAKDKRRPTAPNSPRVGIAEFIENGLADLKVVLTPTEFYDIALPGRLDYARKVVVSRW